MVQEKSDGSACSLNHHHGNLITETITIKHHHVFSCIPNQYLNNKSKAKDTVNRELKGQKKSEEENQIYELSNTIKHQREDACKTGATTNIIIFFLFKNPLQKCNKIDCRSSTKGER